MRQWVQRANLTVENTDKMRNRNDLDGYYAFEWAIARGDGWYLPAIFELERVAENFDAVNRGLTEHGGTALKRGWYASSTEKDKMNMYLYDFNQWNYYSMSKDMSCCVRAFHKF